MSGLTVATYNVHKCVGLDMRRDPARIARVIAEIAPDVIALQEADRRFGDRAGLLDLPALRDEAGLEAVPLGRSGPSHGWHGNVVLTRNMTIEDVRPLRLPGLEPRGAMMIDMGRGPLRLRVVAAHLGLLRASRLVQTRVLLAALAEARALRDDRPAVLMGDLNEWRLRHNSSLHLLAAQKRAPANLVRSFPAHMPVLALDRIMVSPDAELRDFRAHDSALARQASDHLPVTARLLLPGAGAGDAAVPPSQPFDDPAARAPRRAGGQG